MSILLFSLFALGFLFCCCRCYTSCLALYTYVYEITPYSFSQELFEVVEGTWNVVHGPLINEATPSYTHISTSTANSVALVRDFENTEGENLRFVFSVSSESFGSSRNARCRATRGPSSYLNENQQARIIFCYEDEDNYKEVVITGTATSGIRRFTFFQITAGIEEEHLAIEVEREDIDHEGDIQLCISPAEIMLYMRGTPEMGSSDRNASWLNPDGLTGGKIGIGSKYLDSVGESIWFNTSIFHNPQVTDDDSSTEEEIENGFDCTSSAVSMRMGAIEKEVDRHLYREDGLYCHCQCCPTCDSVCTNGIPDEIEVQFPPSSIAPSHCNDLNSNTYVLSKITNDDLPDLEIINISKLLLNMPMGSPFTNLAEDVFSLNSACTYYYKLEPVEITVEWGITEDEPPEPYFKTIEFNRYLIAAIYGVLAGEADTEYNIFKGELQGILNKENLGAEECYQNREEVEEVATHLPRVIGVALLTVSSEPVDEAVDTALGSIEIGDYVRLSRQQYLSDVINTANTTECNSGTYDAYPWSYEQNLRNYQSYSSLSDDLDEVDPMSFPGPADESLEAETYSGCGAFDKNSIIYVTI